MHQLIAMYPHERIAVGDPRDSFAVASIDVVVRGPQSLVGQALADIEATPPHDVVGVVTVVLTAEIASESHRDEPARNSVL
jgi:hypothetical protein